MIRIYFLPVLTTDGTETVTGADLIHDALLLCTVAPMIRKLIMDTSDDEHTQLVAMAADWYEATQEEIDLYHSAVTIMPPDPDYERAKEILGTSPAAITMPEIWELLRILGRRFGYID